MQDTRIKVAIKVRPLIKRELDEKLQKQWIVKDNSIIAVDPDLKKRADGRFTFDHIFDEDVNNIQVFDTIAKPIVEAAVNGYNGTVFAYGQTSSGKTYTMMGTHEEPGVIPLTVEHIFNVISQTQCRDFLIRVSYLQIYKEKLCDLLNKDEIDLKIKEKNGQVTVENCKEKITNCAKDVLNIMKKGEINRKVGETNMNEFSSRSHSIFRITIESREAGVDPNTCAVQVSQLNLVDLAGSERSRATGATGERFKEGCAINQSLSTLSLVIKQLSEQGGHKFVNYRDSILTRLLQVSLGGNAMTAIICAVTPAAFEETQSTLHFAERARSVKSKPKLNEVMSDSALLKRYAKQIDRLNRDLEESRKQTEFKVKEKEDNIQLLQSRIALLEAQIVPGQSLSVRDSFQAKSKRRRTWAGGNNRPLTRLSLYPREDNMQILEPIEEHSSSNSTIDFDIINESVQNGFDGFEDFELQLIDWEDKNSDHESGDEVPIFVTGRRNRRNVNFSSDIVTLNDSCTESTPKKLTASCQAWSPDTPKSLLRQRLAHIHQEYNELREFTTIEKQIMFECNNENKDSRTIISGLELKIKDLNDMNSILQMDKKKLRSDLDLEIMRSLEIANDITSLKDDMKNLESTVSMLTTENSMLSNALEENKKLNQQTENSYEVTIRELRAETLKILQEKSELENALIEAKNALQTECEKVVDEAVDENNKQLSNIAEGMPSIHKCENDDIILHLENKIQLLKAENDKLASILIEKSDENDDLKKEVDTLNRKIEIIEKSHETEDGFESFAQLQFKKRLLEEQLRTSKAEISILMEENAKYSETLSLTVCNPSDMNNGTNLYNNTLHLSVLENNTTMTSTDELKNESFILQEENEISRCSSEKTSSNCKHFEEMNKSFKMIKLDVENVSRTLKNSEISFNRAKAETEALTRKINEQSNVSIHDTSFNTNNASTLNITHVEDEVKCLRDEMQVLKQNSDNYYSKNNDGEYLKREQINEETPLTIENGVHQTESSSSERGSRVKQLNNQLHQLKIDFDDLKKSLSDAQSTIDKYVIEKTKFNDEIEFLKNFNNNLQQNLYDVQNEAKIAEDQIFCLQKEIEKLNNLNNDLQREMVDIQNEEKAATAKNTESNYSYSKIVNKLNGTINGEIYDNEKICHNSSDELQTIINKLNDELIVLREELKLKENESLELNNSKEKLQSIYEEESIKLKNDLQQSESEMKELTETLNKYTCDIDSLKEELKSKENENLELNNSKDKLQSIYEEESIKLKNDLQQSENEMKELTETLNKYICDIDSLKEELKSKESENLDLINSKEKLQSIYEEESTKLKNDLQQSESEIKELTETLNKYTCDIDSLKEELKSKESENLDLINSKEKLQSIYKEESTKLKNDLQQSESEIKELTETLNKYTCDIDSLKEELKSKESENLDLINSKEKLQNMYEEESIKLQNDLQESENKMKDLTEMLNKHIYDNDSLKEKIKILEEQMHKFSHKSENETQDVNNSTKNLQSTIEMLEKQISILRIDLDLKEKLNAELINAKDTVEKRYKEELNATSMRYNNEIEKLDNELKELKAELITMRHENHDLRQKEIELQNKLDTKIQNLDDKNKSLCETNDELDTAKKCIIKEIKSLKPKSNTDELFDKCFNDLLKIFLHEIMLKQEEVAKILQKQFNNDKEKLEEAKKQSIDGEKRALSWNKELEVEIEKLQSEISKQENTVTKLLDQLAQSEHSLKDLLNEKTALVDKLERLEKDYNNLHTELENHNRSDHEQEEAILNARKTCELVQSEIKSKENEYEKTINSMKTTYEKKIEDLNFGLESFKTQNIELKSIIDEMKTNETQLKDLVDTKVNEITRANQNFIMIESELDDLKKKNNDLNERIKDKDDKINDITVHLKKKCDLLSEYKNKYQTILPEFELLKKQEDKKIECLEKYKTELETLRTETVTTSKQLSEVNNKNLTLLSELENINDKITSLERENKNLRNKARNSISKVNDNEVERLRDLNKTLTNNLDGASNRVAELQESKKQLLQELSELRTQLQLEQQNNLKLSNISSTCNCKSNSQYDNILQQKHLLAKELEEKNKLLDQKEKEIIDYIAKNKELDDECEELAKIVSDKSRENLDLEAKLSDLEYKRNKAALNNSKISKEVLQSKLTTCEADLMTCKAQIAELSEKNKNLMSEINSLNQIKKENADLNSKVEDLEYKLDSKSQSNNSGFSSPASKTNRRRRKSRSDFINQRRHLDDIENNCDSELVNLQKKIRDLELEIVSKNGKIAHLEIMIQCENFPHQVKCQELEQNILVLQAKNIELKTEIKKLQNSVRSYGAEDCKTCKKRISKSDQSTQTIENKIGFSGINSGIVNEYLMVQKLEKEKELLKDLCRSRNRRIKVLEEQIQALEHRKKNEKIIEGGRRFGLDNGLLNENNSSRTFSEKPLMKNISQAMKENIPANILDSVISSNGRMRMWNV